MCVDTIRHELRFSVRWNERNGSVALEAGQTDALMKLHVLHGDSFSFVSCDTKKDTMHTT